MDERERVHFEHGFCGTTCRGGEESIHVGPEVEVASARLVYSSHGGSQLGGGRPESFQVWSSESMAPGVVKEVVLGSALEKVSENQSMFKDVLMILFEPNETVTLLFHCKERGNWPMW